MRLSLDVEVMADQHEELEALFAELNEEEEVELERAA
jgi:putative lipoic acid-binding regulatory protein